MKEDLVVSYGDILKNISPNNKDTQYNFRVNEETLKCFLNLVHTCCVEDNYKDATLLRLVSIEGDESNDIIDLDKYVSAKEFYDGLMHYFLDQPYRMLVVDLYSLSKIVGNVILNIRLSRADTKHTEYHLTVFKVPSLKLNHKESFNIFSKE